MISPKCNIICKKWQVMNIILLQWPSSFNANMKYNRWQVTPRCSHPCSSCNSRVNRRFSAHERKTVRRHRSFDIGYVDSRELRWSGLMIKGWDVVSSFIISWEVAAVVARSDAGLHEITQRIIKHWTVTVWENIKDLATDPKVSHRGKAWGTNGRNVGTPTIS